MDSLKAFLREKGLYLTCLGLVFAATATGILAIRSVVRNVADLTQVQQEVEQNRQEAPVQQPVTNVPEPTAAPAPTAATTAPAKAEPAAAKAESEPKPAATAAPTPAPTPAVWEEKPVVAYSGEQLIYHETLGDWRTHNGADYALAAGQDIPAKQAGTVAAVYDDALWGSVVELRDEKGLLWRYCGLQQAAVERGDEVARGAVLGSCGTPPAEADGGTHVHLECMQDEAYLDPAA